MNFLARTTLVFFIALLAHPAAHADLAFEVDFTAQALSDLSAQEQALFIDGLQFWDDIIVGHRDGVMRNYVLEVDTFNMPASGGSVVLGSAGPSGAIFSGVVADANTSGNQFIIATGGNAEFNVNPDAGPLSFNTIIHEIGHALGFGTLWENNEVYNDGIAGNSLRTLTGGTPGEYIGEFALEAFQNEFVGQQGATFVPIELSGGLGTAHGHLDEDDNFGQALTGIVTFDGQDLREELLTGFASPTGTAFLSNTSRESLRDIGFEIVPIVVPEPSSMALLTLCGLSFLGRRHRKVAAV